MTDNEMTVIRAFRGSDKEAAATCPGAKIRSKGMGRGLGIGGGKGPIGVPVGAKSDVAGVGCPLVGAKIRSKGLGRGLGLGGGMGPRGRIAALVDAEESGKKKNKKKAVITKESLAGVSNDKPVDVEVTRIDKNAALAALSALEAMKTAPTERRPSGVTKAKVSEVGALRSKVRSENRKQKQLSALGNTLEPKTAAEKAAQGAPAQAQGQDPYAAMQELAEHGQLLQKAIPGLDPGVVMQGQQQGVDMSPGAIKKRLGAHEMISRGKKILRDDNRNGVPDAAESSMGGNPAMGGQQMPEQPPMVAAAKLYTPDFLKTSTASKQDVKKDDKGDETKPGVVYLASASDTPPKKAPEKKPEAASENEAEIEAAKGKEKKAGLASILGRTLAGGIGGAIPGAVIGGGVGAVRKKSEGEGRLRSILRSMLTGAGVGAGIGAGGVLGGHIGAIPGIEVMRQARSPKQLASAGRLAQTLLNVGKLGGMGAGGAIGYRHAKRQPAAEAPKPAPEKKASDAIGEGSKPLSREYGLPVRDGFKNTNRQEVFNDLAKWSLGAKI